MTACLKVEEENLTRAEPREITEEDAAYAAGGQSNDILHDITSAPGFVNDRRDAWLRLAGFALAGVRALDRSAS